MQAFYRCIIHLCIFTLCAIKHTRAHSVSPIPYGWRHICTEEKDSTILADYLDGGTDFVHVTHMRCVIPTEDASVGQWKFQTFRDWLHTMTSHTAVNVFLTVTCTQEATISLPWPMKAHGLVGLAVSGCALKDRYGDFGSEDNSTIPESLRVLHIQDSVWLTDPAAFEKLTRPENLAALSSDYECGQDSSLVVFITRNVSDQSSVDIGHSLQGDEAIQPFDLNTSAVGFLDSAQSPLEGSTDVTTHLHISDITPDLSEAEKKEAEQEFKDLLNNIQSLEIKCNFEKLKILEESMSQFLPLAHFSVLLQGANYPEVQVLNYSRTGMRIVPQELTLYRKNFPRVKYIDLSHNQITDVTLPPKSQISEDTRRVTFDLRNNFITNLTLQTLLEWAQYQQVHFDIRENPIYCGEPIQDLLLEMSEKSFFSGNLSQYRYIEYITCASPPNVEGTKLAKLLAEASNDSSNSSMSSEARAIVGATVAFVVLVTIAVIAAILVLKSRRRKNKNNYEKQSKNNVFNTDSKTDLA